MLLWRIYYLTDKLQNTSFYTKLLIISSCLKIFGGLYQYMVTCLDAMGNPHLCPEVNESRWDWDSDTKTTAHG